MTAQRPPMTADDARHFETFSVANAAAVAASIAARGCQCRPYEDVFTFARWRAQGRVVRRGEHGLRLVTYVTVLERVDQNGETADGANDQPRGYRMPRPTFVFCRCQTDELGARP